EVTIRIAAAALPDATDPLHRVVRCRIDNRPGVASVIGGRDEQILNAREGTAFIIAGAVRDEEANSSAVFVASNRFREHSALNSMARAEDNVLRPRRALVVADVDVR